jgi:hypothetical protein
MGISFNGVRVRGMFLIYSIERARVFTTKYTNEEKPCINME